MRSHETRKEEENMIRVKQGYYYCTPCDKNISKAHKPQHDRKTSHRRKNMNKKNESF